MTLEHSACLDTLALVEAVLTDERYDEHERVDKAKAVIDHFEHSQSSPVTPADS